MNEFDFCESERIKSAISRDMFDLNYRYYEGYEGYRRWLKRTNKEDARHHRYGNLYDGYLELNSLDYCSGDIGLFQIKPQYPVYKVENKAPDKPQSLPEIGFLNISGTEFVRLANKANLNHKLPHDNKGRLLSENISFFDEKEKYTLARNIGFFDHYKAKPIKYELVPEQEITNIFPLISNEAFVKICENQNLIIPDNYIHFTQKERWLFFKEHGKTIEITEGHKKACSLISHGYLAIASASITTHSKPKKGFEEENTRQLTPLKDDLLAFFNGRDDWSINIVFDAGDSKESTRHAVRKQSFKLSKKLNKYGKVFIRTWSDTECKGIDDYLYKYHNLDATFLLFPSINPKNSLLNKRNLTPDIIVNTKYLDPKIITKARDAGKKMLFVKSAQNTGKTTIVNHEMCTYDFDLKYKDLSGCHVIFEKTQETGVVIKSIGDDKLLVHFFNSEGSPLKTVLRSEVTVKKHIGSYPSVLETLTLTHRQTLASNLVNKLGLRHYQNSRSEGAGEVYCVDSILKENDLNRYTNGFIDEATQVAWHLLSANTDIKNNRLLKIDRIKTLGKNIIKNNGLNILTDADIDDNIVNFYCHLLDISRDDCMVVENKYKPFSNRDLIKCKDCTTWRQYIYDHIENNNRISIHTGGQRHDSTHGTYNLEKDLKSRFPEKKIIRLDAITLQDETHEAYSILNRLYSLKDYDIIIASPSINTGVDLTENIIGKLDGVFGIYYGNYPLIDFEQSLERYRGDAPRYVYLPDRCNNKIDTGSVSADELYENIIGHSRVITNMYEMNNVQLANDLVSFYCNMASVINYEYNNLAESFYSRAEAKGYKVQAGEQLTASERKIIRQQFKEIKTQSISEYEQQVLTAPEIDEIDAKRIESKLNPSYNEQLKLRRHILQKRYCIPYEEVNSEIVAHDKEYTAILNRYYLTANSDLMKLKDIKKLEYFTENNPVLYPIDMNNMVKVPLLEAYRQLGIVDLIDRIKQMPDFNIHDIDSYIETLRTAPHLAETRLFVKQVLKIDVSKNTNATRLFSMILDRFGYSLSLSGARRQDKKVLRRYTLVSRIDETFFSDLLNRWYARDSKVLSEFFAVADISYNYN